MKIEKIIYSLVPQEAKLIRMFYNLNDLSKLWHRGVSHCSAILNGHKTFSGSLATIIDRTIHDCWSKLEEFKNE